MEGVFRQLKQPGKPQRKKRNENKRARKGRGRYLWRRSQDWVEKDEKGKSSRPDDIPEEAWIALGNNGVEFLMNFFNRLLREEKMPDKRRRSMLVTLYKGKGDIKECGNYRGIKLMSHTMKLWERIIEARIRKKLTIAEQQFGFMPGRSTTDAIFCLRMLLEKWTEG